MKQNLCDTLLWPQVTRTNLLFNSFYLDQKWLLVSFRFLSLSSIFVSSRFTSLSLSLWEVVTLCCSNVSSVSIFHHRTFTNHSSYSITQGVIIFLLHLSSLSLSLTFSLSPSLTFSPSLSLSIFLSLEKGKDWTKEEEVVHCDPITN